MKEKRGKGLKISTPKQMLQRLPVALAHVKVGNISKNLLNEVREIKDRNSKPLGIEDRIHITLVFSLIRV